MADLVTETFSGANTIYSQLDSTGVTGFDNGSGIWTGYWWGSIDLPSIGTTYPCPVGSPNSLRFTNDKGNVRYEGVAINEFHYRWYMRLGSLNSYDCTYEGISWAKLIRLDMGDHYCIFNVYDDGDYGILQVYSPDLPANQPGTSSNPTFTGEYTHGVAGWTPGKWYYNEWYVKNSSGGGASDGAMAYRSKNISDNGSLFSWSQTGLNLRGSWGGWWTFVEVGGNQGGPETAPENGVVRYANVKVTTGPGDWIGEVGSSPTPMPPVGTLNLSAR